MILLIKIINDSQCTIFYLFKTVGKIYTITVLEIKYRLQQVLPPPPLVLTKKHQQCEWSQLVRFVGIVFTKTGTAGVSK